MWHTGWFSMYSQESNEQKKNQHEQVETQNRAAQLSRARRGQRHRWIGHSTERKNSNPLKTSIKIKKKGIRKRVPHPKKMKKLWNSPAIRRRWTSWSSFRAIGWSHGNVLAQSRNSSWVQRRNSARNNSWPMGRWWRIFSMSINMAMGTENSTIDCSEFTILNSLTDQTGMSSHGARNGI